MKPQSLVVLVFLIGMLLTLQQVEEVLGDEAVQSKDDPRAKINISWKRADPRAELKDPGRRSNGIFGVGGPIRRTRRPRP
uniref:Uncharacterized protein n=1 Tax=Magallana gigas TaxID=29159 RepID=A0A8W8MX90_MAGGI